MIRDKKTGNWDEALEWRKELAEKKKRVVFTNGCFDILHFGHIKLLEEAGNLGDALVIGLNSDKSIKEIKGEGRPVRDEEERAEILAGLQVVDFVVVFNEKDPLKLIKHLKPDILVKGGDWSVENIIGAQEVKSWNGEVRVIELLPERSTTGLIEDIKRA